MNPKSKRPSFFERVKTGLEEGIEFAKGKRPLRTIEVPGNPPVFSAQQILILRRRMGLSQGEFARMVNVSTKTVQGWEQGVRRPAGTASRLLQVLHAKPDLFCRIIGVGGATRRGLKPAPV